MSWILKASILCPDCGINGHPYIIRSSASEERGMNIRRTSLIRVVEVLLQAGQLKCNGDTDPGSTIASVRIY